ncbi:MAG: GNAT family N-acetyltransferase [Micromonosporaceae bacterium]
MGSPAITLRDMRPDEYEAYAARQEAEYVAHVAESIPIEAAKKKARQDRERFLPHGLATERQRLLVAENAQGEVVGNAWLGLDDPQARTTDVAWLFDIRVEEAHRRSGYATAILAAVEELAREAGADKLGLNVHGHNTAAISLYQATGYHVTAQQMAKPLR